MQFIEQENSFLPAFFVWSIGKLSSVLLSNSIVSGLVLALQFVKKQFYLIFSIFLLETRLFEFKFYR